MCEESESVNEGFIMLQGDLKELAADSEEQQSRVLAVADKDGFNWGYDPVHYGVPEGSYASDPNGPSRILEFRQMVQALHKLGLRVVLDVVYNHTFHSGLDGKISFVELLGYKYISNRNHISKIFVKLFV